MAGEDAENNSLPTKTPSSALAGSSVRRDVENRSQDIYDSVDSAGGSKYTSENYRRAVGASYVLTMGVSGIVLVALASSLKDLADAIDKTSVEVRKR